MDRVFFFVFFFSWYVLSPTTFLDLILTREHAFINDARAADQNSVTGHDGPIAGNDH